MCEGLDRASSQQSSPVIKLAETTTPDGGRLILYEHGGSFSVRLNGLQLMNSAASSSEVLLGDLAAAALDGVVAPRVLIGGLGLGFTLKGLLAKLGPAAKVEVAELVPAVVDWSRKYLSSVNGALLDDPRVEILVEDVWRVLCRAQESCYDALLFDIDNGPKAFVHKSNARLYGRGGLQQIFAVLKAGGRAVFWSAEPAPTFARRLARARFKVRRVAARFHASAERSAGMIYVADKPGGWEAW